MKRIPDIEHQLMDKAEWFIRTYRSRTAMFLGPREYLSLMLIMHEHLNAPVSGIPEGLTWMGWTILPKSSPGIDFQLPAEALLASPYADSESELARVISLASTQAGRAVQQWGAREDEIAEFKERVQRLEVEAMVKNAHEAGEALRCNNCGEALEPNRPHMTVRTGVCYIPSNRG